MKNIMLLVGFAILSIQVHAQKVFDAHLHGNSDPENQLKNLEKSGVYSVAVSTSWTQQQAYQSNENLKVLHGLFVPCPKGKVPYTLQECFEDGKEWPDVKWVEQQIGENKIDFIGEVLTQYHGISMSDTLMFPYYALAEKYGLPVGIHTGSAGPDHGCPNFKEALGNPFLLKDMLRKFPKLKVWMMHCGGPYASEFMEMMKTHSGLYADISVLNNPKIIPANEFATAMKEMIDAGLEDRLLFGSDNADINASIDALDKLEFLTDVQKKKIYYENAERFFAR